MSTPLHDIESIADIELLVVEFYKRAFANEVLAPHFAHMNFEDHKPRMVAFWAFVVLDVPGYTTHVMDKHRHLPIGPAHFQEWVSLFHQTIDQLFTGEKAALAKTRASAMGWAFGEKMKHGGL
jgi:hemoglobin